MTTSWTKNSTEEEVIPGKTTLQAPKSEHGPQGNVEDQDSRADEAILSKEGLDDEEENVEFAGEENGVQPGDEQLPGGGGDEPGSDEPVDDVVAMMGISLLHDGGDDMVIFGSVFSVIVNRTEDQFILMASPGQNDNWYLKAIATAVDGGYSGHREIWTFRFPIPDSQIIRKVFQTSQEFFENNDIAFTVAQAFHKHWDEDESMLPMPTLEALLKRPSKPKAKKKSVKKVVKKAVKNVVKKAVKKVKQKRR